MGPDHNPTAGRNGHLFQINLSKGGVPKLSVTRADVSKLGLVGDHQANSKIHGGVERGLCLYSLERIVALQLEGHPVFPGALGENLTLAGLDWSLLVPGEIISLGSMVSIEITSFTTPCQTIEPYFHEGNILRVLQAGHPGWQIGDRVSIHA
jgi:MOSC domain-containing protein YiiM